MKLKIIKCQKCGEELFRQEQLVEGGEIKMRVPAYGLQTKDMTPAHTGTAVCAKCGAETAITLGHI